MPRRATGQVVEHTGKDGRVYRALRFRAYGKRQYLALGPVTAKQAERELRGVLADVERGLWKSSDPAPEPAPDPGDVTFHELAEQWWIEREHELRGTTQADYRWRLENHLLPFFGAQRVDRITIADVDRYKASKLAADEPLSPASINKTLTLLAAILDVAEERQMIARNPAKGSRRRVRAPKPRRPYLDTAAHITALLDAAGSLDARAREDRRHVPRRAMLATMCFAGLRLGELLELTWRDVDLAAGRLRIGRAKTDAGIRDVRLQPVLRDELASLKAARGHVGSDALVFGTSEGRPFGASNVRRRVLAPAVALADERLEQAGETPLPDRLTPHALRRTFASILVAVGTDPAAVMAEMGHTDPSLTLRIYAHAMRMGDAQREQLRALMEGADWADVGRRAAVEAAQEVDADAS